LFKILRHAFVIILTATAYAIVNATYVLTTGIIIYPGITWDNLNSVILVPLTLITTLGSFYIGKFLYEKVKDKKIKDKSKSFSLPLKE
jgi:hypothetical protein